jgi:hypothetical protein
LMHLPHQKGNSFSVCYCIDPQNVCQDCIFRTGVSIILKTLSYHRRLRWGGTTVKGAAF